MVRVVASKIVKYNRYGGCFEVNTKFQIPIVVRRTAVLSRYVAMVFHCVSEVFLK